MKCPNCGAAIDEKNTCSRCGKRIDSQQHLEVEYKEFTLSEFLEIRKKHDAMGNDPAHSSEVTEAMSSQQRRTLINKEAGVTVQQTGSKKLFLTVTLILLIAAFITGVFFLVKFLFQP